MYTRRLTINAPRERVFDAIATQPCASARPTTKSTPGPGTTISTIETITKPSSWAEEITAVPA